MSDVPECSCAGPGWCPVFNRCMPPNRYEICKGTSGLPNEDEYKHHWINSPSTDRREDCHSFGPTLVRRVRNVIKGVVRHLSTGSRVLPAEHVKARLKVCKSGCEYWSNQLQRCQHVDCGCTGMYAKASWEDQHCPHPAGDKWLSLDLVFNKR